MTRPLELTEVPARSEDVLATQSQDVTVLMSMDTGKFVELNDTARAVWELTDGQTSVEQMIDSLTGQFDVDRAKCTADVGALIARLRDEGLVVLGS